MDINLIGNGPELFRIRYKHWTNYCVDGYPDIMEREFPSKGWVLFLTIGSPQNEFSKELDQEQKRDESEQSWDYIVNRNEFYFPESYPFEADKLHTRHQEILNQALSHPPETTQETLTTDILSDDYKPKPGLFDKESVEKLFQIQEQIKKDKQSGITESEPDLRTHYFPGLCKVEFTHKGLMSQARITFEKYPKNPIYLGPTKFYECRGKSR